MTTLSCARPAPAAPEGALERAAAYLRATQHADTYWAGELSSSALATSMCIVMLHLRDRARYAGPIRRGRRWLLATQSADGGWGDARIDESTIHSTSLALSALALTGAAADDAEHAALARATMRLEQFGGWEVIGNPRLCVLSGPCRTVAALAGLMDPRTIKHLRPEVIFLPPPIRRTVSTTFPAYLSFATLHATMAPHLLNALPTYRRAREAVPRWLARAQGKDGSFEESAFLTALIVLCLSQVGQGALPWLASALRFVLESQREDGGWPIDRDLETFDTDLTVFAFAEAGASIPHGEGVRDWLLARQWRTPCFPTSAPPGGWSWAMPAGWPECDDTAYTILALLALGVPASDPALRRGARWLEHMQNRDGAWATFVRDSRMPFDHDCPYITGHVLCALQASGRLRARPAGLGRALAYLRRVQRHDGSFASIWFREAVAGTASVLEALAACGLSGMDMAHSALLALLRMQNDDGGWGGQRLQPSTAEETSWALLALLRCPLDAAGRAATDRAVRWLIAHQRTDGTWAPTAIGLYFSTMWYADSLYAVTLPMRALARALSRHDP